MSKLPDTIPETLRAQLETPLGFRGRCTPADLWPYIKAWLIKDGLIVQPKHDADEE